MGTLSIRQWLWTLCRLSAGIPGPAYFVCFLLTLSFRQWPWTLCRLSAGIPGPLFCLLFAYFEPSSVAMDPLPPLCRHTRPPYFACFWLTLSLRQWPWTLCRLSAGIPGPAYFACFLLTLSLRQWPWTLCRLSAAPM